MDNISKMDQERINELIEEKNQIERALDDLERKRDELKKRYYKLESILGFNCKHNMERIDHENKQCKKCGFVSC